MWGLVAKGLGALSLRHGWNGMGLHCVYGTLRKSFMHNYFSAIDVLLCGHVLF